jgi:NADPH-dependent curcumin reductase CurA
LKSGEQVFEGVENAGLAMIDMLAGRSLGKTVVSIADAKRNREGSI